MNFYTVETIGLYVKIGEAYRKPCIFKWAVVKMVCVVWCGVQVICNPFVTPINQSNNRINDKIVISLLIII